MNTSAHTVRHCLARVLLAAGFLAAVAGPAAAAPFVPKSDDEVVERLPARLTSATERRAERDARQRLKRDPASLPLALKLAHEAIERARRLGDPRELGQAQAALSTWWAVPDPPPQVRLMRATVRQSQHDFGIALTDLDALLLPGASVPLPVQAQAELIRATVLQVQGRWREASAGCERLAGEHYAALGNAVRLPAQACLAELMSLQGRAAQASTALAQLARQNSGEAGATASWLTLLRAELAERRGDDSAEALFRQALQGESHDVNGEPTLPDVYTLAAYADWLLARGRNRDASALLAGREDADALLLRLAIAWKRDNDPKAAAAIATLASRFEAAALRGDRSHGREESRFELDLRGNTKAALALAQSNWAVQKEPADAIGLLRAAVAARQPEAAAPVWKMVRDTGWQDVRLKPAAAVVAGVKS